MTDLSLSDEASLEKGDASWASALTEAGKASSGKSTRVASSTAPRRAFPTAWLKAATQGPLRVASLSGGWKAVEMSLSEGDGTVTIKARRDQDKVAVSVGFSEPRMQAQASANARQLQEAMQAQYDTDVDLSFTGGDASGSDGETGDSSSRERTSTRTVPADSPTNDEASARRTRRNGERREWIG